MYAYLPTMATEVVLVFFVYTMQSWSLLSCAAAIPPLEDLKEYYGLYGDRAEEEYNYSNRPEYDGDKGDDVNLDEYEYDSAEDIEDPDYDELKIAEEVLAKKKT